jgi:hypothetical protein
MQPVTDAELLLVRYSDITDNLLIDPVDFATGEVLSGDRTVIDDWRPHETTVDVVDRALPKSSAIRYAIYDPADEILEDLPELVSDWTLETLGHVLSCRTGKIAGGWFLGVLAIENHIFTIIDIEGKPLRVDVTYRSVTRKNDVIFVESLNFLERREFSREDVSWSEVTRHLAEDNDTEALEAAQRLFREHMNPTLRNALVDRFHDDLTALSKSGRIPFKEETDHRHFEMQVMNCIPHHFLKGDRAEMDRLVRAAYFVFPDETPVDPFEFQDDAITLHGARNEECHAAGHHRLAASEMKDPPAAVRFLYDHVSPHVWPIGYNLLIGDGAPRYILSSYLLDDLTHAVVLDHVAEVSAHEVLEHTAYLRDWLIARAGQASEEADRILASY